MGKGNQLSACALLQNTCLPRDGSRGACTPPALPSILTPHWLGLPLCNPLLKPHAPSQCSTNHFVTILYQVHLLETLSGRINASMQAKPLNESGTAKWVTLLPAQGRLAGLESRSQTSASEGRAGGTKLETTNPCARSIAQISDTSSRASPFFFPVSSTSFSFSSLSSLLTYSRFPSLYLLCFPIFCPYVPVLLPSLPCRCPLLTCPFMSSELDIKVGMRGCIFWWWWRSPLYGDCLKEICPHPSPCDQPQLQLSLS